MIGVIFDFVGQPVEVRVDGNNVTFRTNQSFGGFVPIDSLRLDKKGVIKEHPDLFDRTDWRTEAINRFKMKIKSYNTEQERINYIIEDLKKYGYVGLYMQKSGGRPVKLE